MLQDTLASTNNAPAITPAEHSTPLSLGEGKGGEAPFLGEGSDMLQDTFASANNAPAKTPAEHSTPLSFGEGQGGEAVEGQTVFTRATALACVS